MTQADKTHASAGIDIHSHIVPETFPPYTGVGRSVPWPRWRPRTHAMRTS